jgi:hypothetical protein
VAGNQLQAIVRTVTQGLVLTVLAAAEIYGLGLTGIELLRDKLCCLVGTIAEGLVLALATCTPEIGLALFNFYGKRGLLCNDRIGHVLTP